MASSLYTLNTSVLSSGKVSNPPQTGLSLSANGVNVISLSAPVYGVAFNKRTSLTTQLWAVTAVGCVLSIDWAYHGDTMLAIMPSTGNVAFQFLSTQQSIPPLTAVGSQYSAPDTQRKRVLGII